MQVIETIIIFIMDQKDIGVSNIISLPTSVGEILIKSFEHCKNR